MAIPTDDLTLMEVSRELGRSLEQVRRYVREEKLPAHKLGMQWFVKRRDLAAFKHGRKGATRKEVLERIKALRESVERRAGKLDVDSLLEESRQSRS